MRKNLCFSVFMIIGLRSFVLDAQILDVKPDTVEQGKMLSIEVTAVNSDFSQGTNAVYVVFLKKEGTNLEFSEIDVKTPNILTFDCAISSDFPEGYYSISIWNTEEDTRQYRT
jgi:hypothetical protein